MNFHTLTFYQFELILSLNQTSPSWTSTSSRV